MSPPPTKEQLAQLDAEDPLKWTRDEFEIPDARASGAKVGKSVVEVASWRRRGGVR